MGCTYFTDDSAIRMTDDPAAVVLPFIVAAVQNDPVPNAGFRGDDTEVLMDMLLAKKRSSDRRAWLERKGNLAIITGSN